MQAVEQNLSKALNAHDHPLSTKRTAQVTAGAIHINFDRITQKKTGTEISGVTVCETTALGSTMNNLQLMELPEPIYGP